MPLWSHTHPGIFIDDSPSGFFAGCSADLNRIASGDLGKRFLGLLSKRTQGIGTKAGSNVVIMYTNKVSLTAQSSNEDGREVRKDARPGSIVRLPAMGTGSVVRYGHNIESTYTTVCKIHMPPYIALSHELVHAFHVISGDVVKEYDWGTDGAIIEEARTVGLGPYKNKTFTENAFRKEHNLVLRTYYSKSGDCDDLPSLTGVT